MKIFIRDDGFSVAETAHITNEKMRIESIKFVDKATNWIFMIIFFLISGGIIPFFWWVYKWNVRFYHAKKVRLFAWGIEDREDHKRRGVFRRYFIANCILAWPFLTRKPGKKISIRTMF